LVSHFLTQIEERRNFFRHIAARLRPGGYLVNADIASDTSTSAHKSLFEVWMRALKYSRMPAEQVEKFRASFGQDVAVLPPHEVESIIASSGFETPVLFLQSLFIHAWYGRRTS
jgi:tRNA (cmo5U34)-methyltransferase